MKLSTPEEIDEEPVVESGEPEPTAKEPTVQFEQGIDPMPVSDAVNLHQEILTNPENFGLVSEATVADLQARVAELEEEVEQLRSRVKNVCPVCGGGLKPVEPGTVFHKKGGGKIETEAGDKKCSGCGEIVDPSGTVHYRDKGIF